MIEFLDVSKIYNVGGEEVRALDHVNMKITEGEFVGIIGPSGSGKSTMMHIMGCLDVVSEGEYLLDNQAIENYSSKELAEIRNNKIGFVFQSFNLISRMSIEENIELPLIYQGVKPKLRRELVAEALEKVNLYERRKHTPNKVSGGQQQRAAIARAIVTKPSLILADEPTGNLDSKTGDEIMKIFNNLHDEGKTIILITHDNDIAEKANRTIKISDGRII